MTHPNNTPRYRLSALLILLSLLLAGCVMAITPGSSDAPSGTAPAATPEPSAETPTATESAAGTGLENSSWQLVAFGPPTATLPVIPESIVTVEFNTNGEVGGSGGCNTYGGQYQTEGDTLIIGELVSTLRACLDAGITEQEMGYRAALQLADRFVISEDTLTIEYGEGSGVLTFIPLAAES